MAHTSDYIYGNTVRKADYTPEITTGTSYYIRRMNEPEREKNPYARRAALRYVLFLMAAMTATGVILANYITLRSGMLNNVKTIAVLEKQLSELKQENDENLTRIEAGIDLNEIRRIAINEYGMSYADDGQIVTVGFEGGGDYVRQLAEIP